MNHLKQKTFVAVAFLTVLAGCKSAQKVSSPAATPEVTQAQPIEIIIDNDDKQKRFKTTGSWFHGQGGGDYGKGVKWCNYLKPGRNYKKCLASWTPAIDVPGRYDVYVWYGQDPNQDHATDAPFTIYYSRWPLTAKKTVRVDLTKNVSQWNLLGTFKFRKGKKGKIELSNNANGNLIADAVKFVYAGK